MMIMIYNGTNKATTSLKRARRQNRELGNSSGDGELGGSNFGFKFSRPVKILKVNE